MTTDSELAARESKGRKRSLDKDLRKIERRETATRTVAVSLLAPGLALAFLALSAALASLFLPL